MASNYGIDRCRSRKITKTHIYIYMYVYINAWIFYVDEIKEMNNEHREKSASTETKSRWWSWAHKTANFSTKPILKVLVRRRTSWNGKMPEKEMPSDLPTDTSIPAMDATTMMRFLERDSVFSCYIRDYVRLNAIHDRVAKTSSPDQDPFLLSLSFALCFSLSNKMPSNLMRTKTNESEIDKHCITTV